MFKSDEFKQDLKTHTLEETLVKHEISFNDAVQLLIRQGKRKKKKKRKCNAKTGEKYILRTTTGKYIIRKYVRGTIRYFGSYDTLEDAIIMRNYLAKNGWYWQRVNEIRKRLEV